MGSRDFFGLPNSPHVRQARGLGLLFAVPCPRMGTCLSLHLPFYSPPFLRLRLGLATQRVLSWGMWRERWDGSWGWVAVSHLR